jgi:hypothetical protein
LFFPWLPLNHSLPQSHCMLLCFFPTSFSLNLFLWSIYPSFLNLFYLFLPLLFTFLSPILAHLSFGFDPYKSPFQGARFLPHSFSLYPFH